MMLDHLCATCDICTFMPKQRYERTFVVSQEKARVLVIDDAMRPYAAGEDMSLMILGDVPFDYTTSVRCEYESGDITPDQEETALARCSVWTKNLVGNYSIYLCTKNALKQLGCGEDKNEGDAFVNPRLGLVLCISPLATITPDILASYTTKTQRLLKKAGIGIT